MKNEPVRMKTRSASDSVIDGLIAGLLGGIGMIVTILVASLAVRLSPADVLASFGAGPDTEPVVGAVMHLSVSGIYGATFGLFARWLPKRFLNRVPGWLMGLVYSGVLLLLALSVILPGLASRLVDLPIWVLILGHGVYGLVLGWQVINSSEQ